MDTEGGDSSALPQGSQVGDLPKVLSVVPDQSAPSVEPQEPRADEGTATGAWDVFVSYRVKPDEPIAEALRDLIVGSISPEPRVFVATSGGLRPSETGFKRQMQMAAKQAHAFVAIITPAFIEREWLFFEAGAAWGREQTYAPFLIDTEATQLPSSIADYQATRATHEKEVEQLIGTIAEGLGRRARRNFGARYRTFRRVLEESRSLEATTPNNASPLDAFHTKLFRAWHESRSGDADAGKTLFDELRSSDMDPDQRASLELMATTAHRSKVDPSDSLQAIESLPPEIRSEPRILYALSFRDPAPTKQVRYLEQILDNSAPTHPVYDIALERLLSRYVNVGRSGESDDLAKRHISHSLRSCRAVASRVWAQIHTEAPLLERLILFCCAYTTKPGAEGLRAALTAASDGGWSALAVHLARELLALESNPDVQFQVGRAYAAAGLTSLAFDIYGQAADAGIAVAKLNMAALVGIGPVPMASLKMMDAHTGDWNCSPAAVPFSHRARMLEAVAEEQKRADNLNAVGDSQLATLVEMAEPASVVTPVVSTTGHWGGAAVLIERAETGVIEVVATTNRTPVLLRLTGLRMLDGVYEVRSPVGARFGVGRVDESGVRIVWLDQAGASFPEHARLEVSARGQPSVMGANAKDVDVDTPVSSPGVGEPPPN